MSEYLSAKELHDVTDYARAAQQVAWLKFRGIPHKQDGTRVIVSRVHVQSRLRVQASTDSPTSRRWRALAGAAVSLQ